MGWRSRSEDKRALRGSLELLFGGIVQLDLPRETKRVLFLVVQTTLPVKSTSRNELSFNRKRVRWLQFCFMSIVLWQFVVERQPRSALLRSSRACRRDVQGKCSPCGRRPVSLCWPCWGRPPFLSLFSSQKCSSRRLDALRHFLQKVFVNCLGIYEKSEVGGGLAISVGGPSRS